MTYTVATLALPPAIFALIKETMQELGQQHRFMQVPDDDGRSVEAIDLNGVAITPQVMDDRDTLINSGRLSDLMVQSNEEAFRAGFEAGALHGVDYGDLGNYYSAWSAYTPSDAILELQSDL